jgi:hypothetical protein
MKARHVIMKRVFVKRRGEQKKTQTDDRFTLEQNHVHVHVCTQLLYTKFSKEVVHVEGIYSILLHSISKT